jgi:hypothetical protein
MIPMVERMRLRPPIQLLQPPSHLKRHDPPRGIKNSEMTPVISGSHGHLGKVHNGVKV